ncbi:hypothetical protein ACLKA7_015588 [Drosophila subpalustris]
MFCDDRTNQLIRNMEEIEEVSRPEEVDSELDEVMEDFVDDVSGIYFGRRRVSLNVPKSIDWRTNILSSIDNRRFNQMLRVSRSQFVHLVNSIKGDEEIAVDLELAIVLFRLGSSESSAAVRNMCTIFGISDGGTLANITESRASTDCVAHV